MKVLIFIVLIGMIISLPGNESRPNRRKSLNSISGFVPHGSNKFGKLGVQRSVPLEEEESSSGVQSNSSKVPIEGIQSDNSVSCRKKRDIRIQGTQDESTGEDNGQRNRRMNELNKNTDEKRTTRSLLNPGSVKPKPDDPTKIDTTTTPSPASYFAVAWIHSFMMK